MSYLLVLGIEGAAGTAFVSAGFEVVSPELQPVSTAPMTIPNSTIRVNILFIVGVRFTKNAKRTSTIFGGQKAEGSRQNSEFDESEESGRASGRGRVGLGLKFSHGWHRLHGFLRWQRRLRGVCWGQSQQPKHSSKRYENV
jgi:hypothetical protein